MLQLIQYFLHKPNCHHLCLMHPMASTAFLQHFGFLARSPIHTWASTSLQARHQPFSPQQPPWTPFSFLSAPNSSLFPLPGVLSHAFSMTGFFSCFGLSLDDLFGAFLDNPSDVVPSHPTSHLVSVYNITQFDSVTVHHSQNVFSVLFSF